MMIILFGSVAILGKKIKNRHNSSAIQPQQHPQQQWYNSQDGNDTILNVINIIYVTIVLASINVPALLIGLKIIPPHPLFLVNFFYAVIYVPSLVLPISFAIIQPKSIKIGIQAFPCCN
jgi:sterol desaturase/sphingolipid hydroxylase (fatty acid hydroxylase superfamily)